MKPEHLGSIEQNRPVEQLEHNMWERESERPSSSEVPHLEEAKDDPKEAAEWRVDDSERVSVELPYLKDDMAADVTSRKMDDEEHNMLKADVDVETDNSGEKQDVEKSYYSTYEERLKQTPKEDSERGEWSGKRGESDFTPNDEEVKNILENHGEENIAYKDAIPDFSEVAAATVEIDDMTENRAENFRQCDENCAELWNKVCRDGRVDWTARDIKDWRQENSYSWHERNDMKTCDLVPTQVNDYFGHLGGVSECKKRDAENGGRDFDE